MIWEAWKERYLEIVRAFGYDPVKEEEAMVAGRQAAAGRSNVLKRQDALAALGVLSGKRCVVTGNAPSLREELIRLAKGGELDGAKVVASDSSCVTLNSLGILPDIIVTDLDGDRDVEKRMNDAGALIVVHFHGDNFALAGEYVKTLNGRVVITTQAGPTEYTFNFGGFTDGDRGVLLCEEFGSSGVVLAGFDFENVAERGVERRIKLAKLASAREIVDGAARRGLALTHA